MKNLTQVILSLLLAFATLSVIAQAHFPDKPGQYATDWENEKDLQEELKEKETEENKRSGSDSVLGYSDCHFALFPLIRFTTEIPGAPANLPGRIRLYVFLQRLLFYG